MIFRQLTNRAVRPESYRSVIFLRQCRREVQHLLEFLTSALLLREKLIRIEIIPRRRCLQSAGIRGGRKFQKDMVKYSCKNAKAGNVNLRCLKQRRFLHYNESAKEEFTMFQDNLKALRKKKGLTQEELAARLNVVIQTVSK